MKNFYFILFYFILLILSINTKLNASNLEWQKTASFWAPSAYTADAGYTLNSTNPFAINIDGNLSYFFLPKQTNVKQQSLVLSSWYAKLQLNNEGKYFPTLAIGGWLSSPHMAEKPYKQNMALQGFAVMSKSCPIITLSGGIAYGSFLPLLRFEAKEGEKQIDEIFYFAGFHQELLSEFYIRGECFQAADRTERYFLLGASYKALYLAAETNQYGTRTVFLAGIRLLLLNYQ